MSQGPVASAGPESTGPLDDGVLEPPSEPELELEPPFDPGPLELPLDPELPVDPEPPLDPDVPLDPELDDSLVSPPAPPSGNELAELPPLDAHA
jgi:hypothetical protein